MSGKDYFGTFLRTLNDGESAEIGVDAQKLAEDLNGLFSKIEELERKVAQQDRTIVGLQNELIRAGRFSHDDPDKKIEGIQVLLTKAGEYKGRERRNKRG